MKNQLSSGSCWAFAANACLEANLWPGEPADFSENHMKNTHGFDWGHSEGGNADIAAAYLLRWSGPVNEADDPFDPASGLSPSGLSARKHIQGYRMLPNRTGPTDNAAIKQCLMNYTPVHTSIYWNSTYYDPVNCTYYDNSTNELNHAVVIVGWDDSYSRMQFTPVPPGDGAFIIRNSWGDQWGEDGYFYVSYYSNQLINNTVFDSIEAVSNYDHIHQYDPLGCIGSFGFGTTSGWGANVFTASGSDRLTAVGFYALAENTSYEVRVYRGVTSGPATGTLAQTRTGTAAAAGFHTIQLDTPVSLDPGEKFAIAVRLDTPGYNYPIAMEYPLAYYSSAARANPGESYYSSSGTSWSDITGWKANTNVCIKAYCGNPLAPTAVISYSPLYPSTGEIVQFSGANSSDPDGSITGYAWDLDNDGAFDDGVGVTASWTFSEEGLHPVRLRVTDNSGYEDIATVSVTVGNRPPTASIQVTPESPLTNETITFDATASSDPDGSITGFAWDLDNDGQFDDATTAICAASFAQSGSKTVRVRVTDDEGATGVASIAVTVKNRPPVASVTASTTEALTRESITFSASGSTDPDGTITQYKWDFDNDGLFDDHVGVTVTYFFSNDGTYPVHVRVTDNNGATATASVTVTVLNQAPRAGIRFLPAEPIPTEQISFASSSSDVDGFITEYAWDLDGDGIFDDGLGTSIAHRFDSPGTYPVSIRVTDDDGASNTGTTDVIVRDISEIAGLEIRTECNEVHLSWINPSTCWGGTRIVRRSDRFPDSISDGTMVYEGYACAAVDAGLEPGTYYYRVFTRSQSGIYSVGVTGTAALAPVTRKKLFFRNGLPNGTTVSAMSWSGDMLSHWNTPSFTAGKGASGRTSGFWIRFPDIIGGMAGQIPMNSYIARARLTLPFWGTRMSSEERHRPHRIAVYRVPDPDQLGVPYFGTTSGIRTGLDFMYRDHRPGINRPWKTGAADITALLAGEQPVYIAEFIPYDIEQGAHQLQLDITNAVRQWVGEEGPAQPNQGLFITIEGDWAEDETMTFYGVASSSESSRPSLEVVCDTTSYDGSAPQKVGSLSAVPKHLGVTLAWQNPAAMSGVKVIRKAYAPPIGPDDGVLVYDGSGQTVTDTGANNGTNYFYGVFTYDAARDYGEPVIVEVIPGTTAAPEFLTAVPSPDGVVLSWPAVENADGYAIYRKTANGEKLSVGYSTSTQWTDRRVLNETYTYWVVGTSYYGRGVPSGPAQCTPAGSQVVPAAPYLYEARSISGASIIISWSDESDNAVLFVIERRIAGGSWTEVARTDAYQSFFIDTGLTPGTTYEYRIYALNAAGSSGFHAAWSATTSNVPFAPSNLQWTVVSGTRVNLSWGDTSSNETGFRVDVRNLGDGIIRSITLGANATSCPIDGLTAGTSYVFVVTAFNDYGGASARTEVVIMPTDPKN